jgi:hypothetical protein
MRQFSLGVHIRRVGPVCRREMLEILAPRAGIDGSARNDTDVGLADRNLVACARGIGSRAGDERPMGPHLPAGATAFGILCRGEVSEWLMVPLSKSGVRKHRGFESRPLRHRLDRQTGRPAPRRSASLFGAGYGRGRLVDYGAALEMRFGATRRGFESRPLRHSRTPGRRADGPLASGRTSGRLALLTSHAERSGMGWVQMGRHSRSALDSRGRARRGTSGALNLQSAPAGLNPHPRSPFSRAAASSDVEDRVPRSGESRTVSGPEGSSTKRSSSGAAERPGPSRSSRWVRVSSGRRWVHGNDYFAAPDRTGAS